MEAMKGGCGQSGGGDSRDTIQDRSGAPGLVLEDFGGQENQALLHASLMGVEGGGGRGFREGSRAFEGPGGS